MLAYIDLLGFVKPDKDTNVINDIYPRIKTLLPKMRNLKTIEFNYSERMYETIKLLDLKGLQKNGVEVKLVSGYYPQNHKHTFIITADEGIILHTHKEIKALDLIIKGDIEIEVYTWDFTFIVNNEYLLWLWYWMRWFEIDWEMIESKQKIKFPKFAEILIRQYEFNLILIPLNRIKKVSYNVYFGRKIKVNDDIKKSKEWDW